MPIQDSPRPQYGSVAVIVDGGKLLLIRRSDRVIAPRAYCFPGGAIEDGEDEQTALRREIEEELGGAVVLVRRLWESVTPWGVHLAWWLCRWAGPSPPQANPLEVESIHWVTTAEMERLPDLLESNRQFLRALAAGEFCLEGL